MKHFYLRLYIFLIALVPSVFLSQAYYDSAQEGEDPYIPTILIVEDDDEAKRLEDEGVIIWRRREDMALALVPRHKTQEIQTMRAKAHPELRRKPLKAVPVMDVAKKYFGADRILTGSELPDAYTGKGVVVGFCDTGFDPHHVNFLDKDGKTRVKRIVYYDEPKGIRKVMDTESEIMAWTSDSEQQTHATHVAGIMTGSYSANGYSGMAPDADIVAVTSQLYDAGILSACEDIIEYAASVGKPAVINLSLGSYNGPHDGTSLFNRYMSLLGKEAIICMAAGNEGNKNNSYRITFDPQRPEWRVRVHSFDYVQYDMYGLTDAWSLDTNPIYVRFHVYDGVSGASVYSSDLMTDKTSYPFVVDSEKDAEFAKFMEGRITFNAGIDPKNGRWFTEILYDTHTDESNPDSGGQWARYNIALEFRGEYGTHADITNDCQYSRFMGWPGYPPPTSDLSVSDISTGDNIICVGMYNNRSEVPNLEGSFNPTGFVPFTIHPASGYGTLVDGRILPHSVAPGGGVISSANTFYVEANPNVVGSMNVKENIDGRDYYWNLNGGTSMSTPYLAGVIATWLEADPSLNIDDVKKILSQTNDITVYDSSDPRNGQGWLRPFEGMKMVINNSGIVPGKVDTAETKIVIRGETVEILNPSGNRLTAEIYSAAGMCISSSVIESPFESLDISSLDSGLYLIRVHSPSQKPIVKKFIR